MWSRQGNSLNPAARISAQIHFEITECAGGDFLKGNPGVPALGGPSHFYAYSTFQGRKGQGTQAGHQGREGTGHPGRALGQGGDRAPRPGTRAGRGTGHPAGRRGQLGSG